MVPPGRGRQKGFAAGAAMAAHLEGCLFPKISQTERAVNYTIDTYNLLVFHPTTPGTCQYTHTFRLGYQGGGRRGAINIRQVAGTPTYSNFFTMTISLEYAANIAYNVRIVLID